MDPTPSEKGANAVVDVNRLSCAYGRYVAVRDLSLHIKRGTIYGLVGVNGAGKSTTLRALLGLVRPASGSIRLFGEKLPGALPRVLSRAGAMLDNSALYGHLTARENAALICTLRGLDRRIASELFEELDIARYANRQAQHLSEGNRQRLGVALALLGKPELLILDEPWNGFDPVRLRSFRGTITKRVREDGTTAIISSHQICELGQMADRVGIMDRGHLIREIDNSDQAGGPGIIVIRASPPEQAANLLRGKGWEVETDRGEIRVTSRGSESANNVLRVLVEANIQVTFFSTEAPSLESAFFKAVRAEDIVNEKHSGRVH